MIGEDQRENCGQTDNRRIVNFTEPAIFGIACEMKIAPDNDGENGEQYELGNQHRLINAGFFSPNVSSDYVFPARHQPLRHSLQTIPVR